MSTSTASSSSSSSAGQHIMDSGNPMSRRRVRQLSSVKAWCQIYGLETEGDGDIEASSYQSFPDLRKLLDEECAEIERKELEAKASMEARIRRRNSDSLSDIVSEGGRSNSGSPPAGRNGEFGASSRIMDSLYRFIDPIIPALGAGGNSKSGGSGGARA
ncbi:hypothetical protein LPJ66_005670 [Kickxella alabastrina]|uniref:Uncharacterized protein n=1 Tax=Kickxella alabastrina TaxID=61397 RepID=A0ACC1IM47_9FUNG|nr:hypothetical protein LPJ66_005670 [Kickxella alabastrina]